LLERAPLFLRNHASIAIFSGDSGARFLSYMVLQGLLMFGYAFCSNLPVIYKGRVCVAVQQQL